MKEGIRKYYKGTFFCMPVMVCMLSFLMGYSKLKYERSKRNATTTKSSANYKSFGKQKLVEVNILQLVSDKYILERLY